MEYNKILDWVKSENIRGYELETDRCVADVIENFLNENKQAINYSRCCETLKDKENLSFKGWMRLKGYEKSVDEPWLKDGKICTGSEIRYMLEQYKTL